MSQRIVQLRMIIVPIVVSVWSVVAIATGTSDGGGGKGVICQGHVYSLDLFEARERGQEPINEGPDLINTLRLNVAGFVHHFSVSRAEAEDERTSEGFVSELKNSILGKIHDLPLGSRLDLTEDATLPPVREGCRIIQIMTYDDLAGQIYRDLEYWLKLDLVDQGALVFHEWVYRRARLSGAITSDETRWVIGAIFSGENLRPIFSPIWDSANKLWCGAGKENMRPGQFEFFAAEERRGDKLGLALYFNIFRGALVTSQLSAFLPAVTLSDFKVGKYGFLRSIALRDYMHKQWRIEFLPNSEVGGFKIRAFELGGPSAEYSNGFCSEYKESQ